MVFLHSHGVGTSRAVRIFKTYGPDAIAIISENPYRLAADIRESASSPRTRSHPPRHREDGDESARAGIGYTLSEATDDGHCGLRCRT